MSGQLVGLVLAARIGDGKITEGGTDRLIDCRARRAVMVILAEWTGSPRPPYSNEELAELSGWSLRTVRRTLTSLEADGYIAATDRGGGRRRATRWAIDVGGLRTVTRP